MANRVILSFPSNNLASQSQAVIANDGITYNQSGLTFNQAGTKYGGLYGKTEVYPTITASRFTIPSASARTTTQQITAGTTTYNQSGITFNESGYQYGGLYNYKDIQPLIVATMVPTAHVVLGSDYIQIQTNRLLLIEDGTNLLIEDGSFLSQE